MKKANIISGYSCNNHCIFCQYMDRKNLPDMTTEEVRLIIRKARDEGAQYINLSGGEFLIRKDAIELISYAKQIGFKTINITTNGAAMSIEKYAEDVIKAGANSFVFSLNGHNVSLNDFITENKGSFRRLMVALENIRKLNRDNNIKVSANVVIIKQNYKFLRLIGELLHKRGVHSVRFSFVYPEGSSITKFSSLVPKISDVAPYLRGALRYAKEKNLDWKVENFPLCHLNDLIDYGRFDGPKLAFKGYAKPESCKGCSEYDNCLGVRQDYLKKYSGDELVPIIKNGKFVLLVWPPIYDSLLYNSVNGKPLVSLFRLEQIQPSGILRIGAYLKSKGYDVKLIDCLAETGIKNKGSIKRSRYVRQVKAGNFENEGIEASQYHIGMSYEDFEEELINTRKPDEIMISTMMTYYWEPVHEIVKICKKVYPDVPVTLGGIYATLCPEHAKKSGADKVFKGFLEEADNFQPDLSLLSYKPHYAILKSTRGCPNNCSYCAVSILEGRKMWYLDPEKFVNGIEAIKAEYGIRRFEFWESNFLINYEKHLGRILDLIIERDLKLGLNAPEGFEPKRVTMEMANKLNKVGFRSIGLAVETLDRKLLNTCGKDAVFSDFTNAVKILKAAGFKKGNIHVFVLIGLYKQSLKSVIKTCVEAWKEGCITSLMPFTPIPGTRDFQLCYDVIKDKELHELHPSLLCLANDEIKLSEAIEIYMLSGEKDPIRKAENLSNNSRVRELIKEYAMQ